MKNEQKKLDIEIHVKPAFQSNVLLDGEIELLMSVLPELLLELALMSEVA
ncbi:MAG: hypothetical protein H7Z18_11370 [Methylophilaceae bacterium]|nr:hypothetical protein [Methylophilaceae bacterium]